MTQSELNEICDAAENHDRLDIRNGLKLIATRSRDELDGVIRKLMDNDALTDDEAYIAVTYAVIGFSAAAQALNKQRNAGDPAEG
jgi:hypothetical protein